MRKIFLTWLLACMATALAFGQTRLISGVVTDNESIPLEAVTVVIVGTQKTVTTDAKGNFKIEVSTGQSLRFIYIGTEPLTIPITAESANLKVKLDIAINKLNEVVVTGYQK